MDSLNDSADIFANSSTETVTENIIKSPESKNMKEQYCANRLLTSGKEPLYSSSPILPSPRINDEDTSFLVNQFVSETCNAPMRIYCPFCPLDYGFEFLLKDHIKALHSQELNHILRAPAGDVRFFPCPFCHAKFYVKELLPKHIVRKHEKSVVEIFSGEMPKDYIECKFCPHKVLKKHHKLLIVHIEKKHFSQFENYVYKKYSNIEMSCEDLIHFDRDAKLTTQIITSSLGFESQYGAEDKVIYARKPIIIKPILKVTSSYSPEESSSDNKELLIEEVIAGDSNYMETDHEVEMDPSANARRKLRFDLPDSPTENNENWDPKLTSLFKKKSNSKWKFFKKSKKSRKDAGISKESPKKLTPTKSKKLASPLKTGLKSNMPLKQFKCGLCLEGFENNPHLLDHLKQKHRGINFQAQYRCGECHAKFYRNSFLVRHCWHHHTPLCLKSPPENI